MFAGLFLISGLKMPRFPSFQISKCPDFQISRFLDVCRQSGAPCSSNGSPKPPSPRDLHTAVVHGRGIYIFGGYDGYNRVDDFHRYDIQSQNWQQLDPTNPEQGPSPRHSHSSVVHEDHMYVFGGYDGHYRNDLYKYNFKTNMWHEIRKDGIWPKSRYRTSATVLDNKMYLFGGHDGARQLNDFYYFNF